MNSISEKWESLKWHEKLGVAGSVVTIMGLSIFGVITELFISTSEPKEAIQNQNMVANGDLIISSEGQSRTNVVTGIQLNQNYPISPDFINEIKKLGIAETAINNFFSILKESQVPEADWDKKLREIAEDYLKLKQQAHKIQTNSLQGENLKAEAEQAIDTGEFDKAEELFNEIRRMNMEAAKQNILFAAEADATNGALAQTRLQYAKAGKYYEQAAQAISAMGGEHHGQWSGYLNAAGLNFQDAGQYHKARSLLEKALFLREQYLDADHIDIATSLNNLANVYQRQGQYEKALPLYERGLDISENALGKDHPDVATTLNNLASLYESMGQYEKALPLYERALGVYENALGKDHPSVATTLNNLALLYEAQGQYEKALPLYERVLGIREEKLGKDHPSVATTLNNLALLYQAQDQYKKVLPLYERALGILENAVGKDHPDVATTLNNLAALYQTQDQYEKALPLYERALGIREEKLGKDHPDVATTLNNLGVLHFYTEEYAKSADYLQQALIIRKDKLGDEHLHTKSVQKSLVFVQEKLQRKD